MGEIIKSLSEVFGVYALFFAIAGWILKTVIIEGLRRESEKIKDEARRELAEEKQRLDIDKRLLTDLRTEFMAEKAIKSLLEVPGWEQRSFVSIKKRIGGFEETDLRKLLVQSGAIQFWGKPQPNGQQREYWGLISIEKNRSRLLKKARLKT